MSKEKLEQLSEPLESRQREGARGKIFTYYPVKSVIQRLNEVFLLDWSFHIEREIITNRDVAVLIALKYPTENGIQTKMQYGGMKWEDNMPLADQLKRAAQFALKKAAENLGIIGYDEEEQETAVGITPELKSQIKAKLKALGKLTPESEKMLDGLTKESAEKILEGLNQS